MCHCGERSMVGLASSRHRMFLHRGMQKQTMAAGGQPYHASLHARTHKIRLLTKLEQLFYNAFIYPIRRQI